MGFGAPWRFPALAFEIVKVLLIWDAELKDAELNEAADWLGREKLLESKLTLLGLRFRLQRAN